MSSLRRLAQQVPDLESYRSDVPWYDGARVMDDDYSSYSTTIRRFVFRPLQSIRREPGSPVPRMLTVFPS